MFKANKKPSMICINKCISKDPVYQKTLGFKSEITSKAMKFVFIKSKIDSVKTTSDVKEVLKSLNKPISDFSKTLMKIVETNKKSRDTLEKRTNILLECVKKECDLPAIQDYKKIIIYSIILRYILQHEDVKKLIKEYVALISDVKYDVNLLTSIDLISEIEKDKS